MICERCDASVAALRERAERAEAALAAIKCPGCDGSGMNSREAPGDEECPFGCRGDSFAQVLARADAAEAFSAKAHGEEAWQSFMERAEKAEGERDAFVAVLDPEDRNVVGAMANAQRLQADLDAYKHEAALIEVDTRRGITDCSTPLFQRVRNIVEALAKADAELKALSEAYERLRQEKARELCYRGWHEAAAQELDVAAALREAYERGRQEERWECWHAVDAIAAEAYLCIVSHSVSHPCAQECADALNARGPMRKPEEEE